MSVVCLFCSCVCVCVQRAPAVWCQQPEPLGWARPRTDVTILDWCTWLDFMWEGDVRINSYKHKKHIPDRPHTPIQLTFGSVSHTKLSGDVKYCTWVIWITVFWTELIMICFCYMERAAWTFCKASHSLFHWREEIKPVWNNMKGSKWYNLEFWMRDPLLYDTFIFLE